MELQKTPNNQSYPEREEQSQRHRTSRFQTTLRALVIKTAWHQHKIDTETNGIDLRAQE